MDSLQVVTEPRRREILLVLGEHELPAGDIASRLDVSFSAVSQHLGRLLEVGAVQVRRDGRRRLYKADRARLAEITGALQSMWSTDIERLARLAEIAERYQHEPSEERR